MNDLWLDTETYSELPLKTHGMYAYAEKVEIMIVSYAIDDGPIQVWDRTTGSPMPEDLAHAIYKTACRVHAHNAMFDRTVLRLGDMKLDIPIWRWRCSMVRALSHGLPGGLGVLSDIFGLPAELRKHEGGRDLVMLFCKPRPANSKLRRATRETHPKQWAEFVAYAGGDISAMRALDKLLPRWNYDPQWVGVDPASGPDRSVWTLMNVGEEGVHHWHLDQTINDRGFAVDVDLAHAAMRAVDAEKRRLASRVKDITGGQVEAATQRDALLEYILQEHGVVLPDMRKDTLERRLQDPELPRAVRDLLAIRLDASSTSVSKYKSFLKITSSDGRARGTLQFAGAARTRRHAGRGVQPQNFPRPDMDQDLIDLGIDALKLESEDLYFDSAIRLASSAVRGTIIAPPGRKLVVADLANIEGRAAAYVAGEEWKLQAFRDYDTILGYDGKGKPVRAGPDLYRKAYASSFRVDVDSVNSDQRQIGKVQELMLQYQGAVGAFLTGAATYGIDLVDMADAAWDAIPGNVIHEATDFHQWMLKQPGGTDYGLAPKVFIVCDSIKRLWRAAHPAISTLWKELETAAIMAVESPGKEFVVRKLRVIRTGSWLRIILPSGYALCYPQPRVIGDKLSYMGVNQYTKKWSRIATYGGKLFENVCQAFAGDVLKYNMPAMDEAGYELVLTVHDEAVTETPDTDQFTVDGLVGLLTAVPLWAPGIPLAGAGFSATRYGKH